MTLYIAQRSRTSRTTSDMDFHRSNFLFPCFIILLLGACPARGQVQRHYNFSYDVRSPIGPSHWGEIKPEWRTCSTGKRQSPIDIRDDRAVVEPNRGNLKRSYEPSRATLTNIGFEIALEWKDGSGKIDINGIMYTLRGCHWHVPGEHLINGRRFDLEIHLVHQSSNGNLAVISMLYEIGEPDLFLSEIQDTIKKITNTINEERDIGNVDPEKINIVNGAYYRYIGSLTVPPCSESVVWTVMAKVSTVSREQVQLFRDALVEEPTKTNARPVQPLNDRLINLYKPTFSRGGRGDLQA